jgi:YD repeat-containing protein
MQNNYWKAVAIVLGAMAGIASMAHADIIPPKVVATTPGGLNVADGSLQYSVTDLALGTLKLERFYRTSRQQPNDPAFGTNFSNNFDIYVAYRNSSTSPTFRTVHIGNGASGTFAYYNSSTILPSGMDAEKGTLTQSGSQFIYVDGSDSSGTIYTFSATVGVAGAATQSRRVERIDFPDGRRQTFSYSGNNLKLVEDSGGYAVVFDYNASGDATAACIFNRSQSYVSASSTCSGAQIKTAYGYTVTLSKPYLTSVTDVLGQVTSYTNDNWGMTCLKPPGYSSCTMSNSNHSTRIGSQTLLDGGTWVTSGANPDVLNDPDAGYAGFNEASYTDPDGNLIAMTYQNTSPLSIRVNGVQMQFKFNGADPSSSVLEGSFLMEATYPEGNKYKAEYLGPFRAISKETMVAKSGTGLADLVKQYGYGSCTGPIGSNQNCAKPVWIRDPKLNQTDFSYATHGGMLSEMKPAPVAGASRPLRLFTYVQKYAYVKNSGGSLVQAATPIWMTNTETQCQTVAGSSTTTCDPSGPQIVTTYEYGANGTANNLLVRGVAVTADGQTRRTCYGYDALGRRISETKPNAGLGACP